MLPGFVAPCVTYAPEPDEAELALLQGAVCNEMLEATNPARGCPKDAAVSDAPPMTEGKALAQGWAGLTARWCCLRPRRRGDQAGTAAGGTRRASGAHPSMARATPATSSGINRNKKSIGLDLSKPAGRQVLLRLLQDADVLVENFKPGSMSQNCPLPEFSRSCDRRPLYLADRVARGAVVPDQVLIERG